MLMNSIMQTYRELFGQVEMAQPLVTVPNTLPAANAGQLRKAEMQARRTRRQRRLVRASSRRFAGWTVRTW